MTLAPGTSASPATRTPSATPRTPTPPPSPSAPRLVPLGADVLPSSSGIGASTQQGSKAEGEHTYFRACLAARRGKKDAAVRLVETAIGEGWPFPPFSDFFPIVVHQDPNLDPLRGYPPFEKLVAPKG